MLVGNVYCFNTIMSLDLPQKVNGIDGFDVPELISFYYMYVLAHRVTQIVRTIVFCIIFTALGICAVTYILGPL